MKIAAKMTKSKLFWFWLVVSNLSFQQVVITGTDVSESINDLIWQKSRMKYIFIWTSPTVDPIMYLGEGQNAFLQKNCAEANCYVTSELKFRNNILSFDMVLFHGPEIVDRGAKLPTNRSPHQIYVFASKESSANYLVCNRKLNNFFNWTWTYKLKSDITYGYILIKDKQGNVIGPNEHMNWMKVKDMNPIGAAIKNKLKHKVKAVAWFVSNCKANNNRREVATQMNHELKKHRLTLDVYGNCGRMKCRRDSKDRCSKIIDKRYYFYLAFENSFGENYVTEKLLRGLTHYAVPVVYGGANYTRFMPDGIYLNVRKLGVVNTVEKMVYLIKNKKEYYKYFRWHNHYSYHHPNDFPETDPYCNLCAALNDEKRLKSETYYRYFDLWWNELKTCTSNT